MTKDQFNREKKYQAALAIAKAMLSQGIIDESDFQKIEEILRVKFCPFIGSFEG